MPDQEIRAASLEYHRHYPPGKISVQPTKHLTNQRDLALAYTPGVAAACDEIVRDRPRPATSPRGATSSAWSPTGRRCWGSVRSARWGRSR